MQTSTEHLQTAIDELINIPSHWQLTPLGKYGIAKAKAPYLDGWQNIDLSINEIEAAIQKDGATGYGIRLGQPSGGLMALDLDGQSAIDKARELFGDLPKTVSWTSGTPGRYQSLYQVPEAFQQLVKTKKIETKPKDGNNKGEGLEFRYTKLQQQCQYNNLLFHHSHKYRLVILMT